MGDGVSGLSGFTPFQGPSSHDAEEAASDLGAAAAEVSEDQEKEETGGTKKSTQRQTNTGETGTASGAKNESGDMIVSGVGGSSTGGEGGQGGQGQSGDGGGDPSKPSMPEGDAELLAVPLQEVSSAIVAAIYAMALSEVAETQASMGAAESLINAIYQNMDSTIDQTGSLIAKEKLAEAKEKRIEAEKKATKMGGILGAIIGVVMVVVAVSLLSVGLAPVALLVIVAMPMVVAMVASGGMEEGGFVGGMLDMLGIEDTALNRTLAIVLISVLVVVIGFATVVFIPFMLPAALSTGALMLATVGAMGAVVHQQTKGVEDKQKESEKALNFSIPQGPMSNAPSAIKQALMDGGMDEEQAEMRAMLIALIVLLMMMMMGQAMSGASTGALAAALGGGEGGTGVGDSSSPSGAGEGVQEGEGSVSSSEEGGLFSPESSENGRGPSPTGEPKQTKAEAEPAPFSEMAELGEMDFGAFTEGGGEGGVNPMLDPQFAGEFGKAVAANIDLNEMLDAMLATAKEDLGYGEQTMNHEEVGPKVQAFTQEHGKGLATFVGSTVMLLMQDLMPSLGYVGSLLEEDSTAEEGFRLNTDLG